MKRRRKDEANTRIQWSELRSFTVPQLRLLEEFYKKNPTPGML
jgi:hypothetical protein